LEISEFILKETLLHTFKELRAEAAKEEKLNQGNYKILLKDNTNKLFNGPRSWMFPRICRFYRNASVISKVQMLLKVTSLYW
jgi:hypothetical protein